MTEVPLSGVKISSTERRSVVQRGIELLREEAETREAELSALRALLDARAAGEFVTVEAGREATETMIAAKRRALGF